MSETDETQKEEVRKRLINKLGEKFIISFFRMINTAKVHDDNNQLVISCLNDFLEAVKNLCKADNDDQFVIRVSGGRLYIQDQKLSFSPEVSSVMNDILGFLEERKLQGLRMDAAMKDAPPHNILDFARMLHYAIKHDDPLTYIFNEIQNPEFMWVELLHRQHTGSADIPIEELSAHKKKMRVKKAHSSYSYALASVKEVTEKISSSKPAGIRKTIRMVQNMVELVMDDESVLMGMSTIRDYDDYTYTHSVNVAILSMCLGKYIGLSKDSLEKLGICALFHDIGKVDVPPEILNKPGKLTDEEFEIIMHHPLDSVCQIIMMNAPRKLKAAILLPPIEHHMKYDLTGYPNVKGKSSLTLFGRILAIADVFDAITSPRKYRPTTLSPDRALKIMIEKIGIDFDPILLKAFINMLGAYPMGTVVELDTGEIGIVIEPSTLEAKDRPKIIILLPDEETGEYKRGPVVDLASRHPQTTHYLKNIVESHHPACFGIQPAAFLQQ